LSFNRAPLEDSVGESKKKPVFNRDIALFIQSNGFVAAKAKYGRILTAARARDVIKVMKEAGAADIPKELQDLADKIRRNGPRLSAPEIGDKRNYKAARNSRVSANMSPYGVGPGDQVIVHYRPDGVLMKKGEEKKAGSKR
jgi:hypothetical protein